MRFSVTSSPRVRFSVTSSPRVRFSVECVFPHLGKRGASSRKSAFCNRRLTEKRILQPAPHGKAQSPTGASRKSALCNRSSTAGVTKKRSLQPLLDRSVMEKRSLRTTPHKKHTLRSPDGQATSFCETAQPECTSDSPRYTMSQDQTRSPTFAMNANHPIQLLSTNPHTRSLY